MDIDEGAVPLKKKTFLQSKYTRVALFVLLTVALGVICQKLGEFIQPGFFVAPVHLPPPFEAVNVMFFSIALVILLIEAVFVGWQESSIHQLTVKRDKSSNTDLMYLVIWTSGFMIVMAVVMTMGLTLFLTDWIIQHLGFGLMTWAPPWIAAPFAVLWYSIIQYWGHRLAHTPWLWDLHKSHHAPSDFTVLTAFREHPIEIALGALTYSIALAPLGLNANTIVVMQVMSGVVPLYLHSKLYKLAWLERLGFATPAGHRIHHSILREHHDMNFGTTLNIWDRVFGTYVKPYEGSNMIPLGVDDSPENHNNERPYFGIWAQTVLWFKNVGIEIKKLGSKKKPDAT